MDDEIKIARAIIARPRAGIGWQAPLALAESYIEMWNERAAIVDACGFAHDDDPEAPKTLTEYVRETQKFAVGHMENWTSDHKDAAVRRLSRNSEHLGGVNDQLRDLVAGLKVKVAGLEGKLSVETERSQSLLLEVGFQTETANSYSQQNAELHGAISEHRTRKNQVKS